MPTTKPGVFCLEGEWSSRLTDARSVEPLLTVLKNSNRIKLVHRRVNSPEDFRERLTQWQQKRYSDYTLGYFGFHGTPGHLNMGRKRVPLEDVAECLSGRCQGKILYFGSCSTLRMTDEQIEFFLHTTGARSVIGFTKSIDWLESAAFDLVLFEALTRCRRIDGVYHWIHREHPCLVRRLGFRMHYGQRVIRPRRAKRKLKTTNQSSS